jgi:HTH-type transcriptional regulator, sugar sensing transcriptional regulator
MDLQEHVKNLQILGISQNQAKIYLNLVKELNLSTEQIVERTKIHRTKIYNELQNLELQGWLQREEGRPIKYIPIDPNIIVKNKIAALQQSLFSTETHLLKSWETRGKYQISSITVISGEDSLQKETIDELLSAKQDIIFLLRFVFEDEIVDLLKILKRKKSEGLNIKILIFPELFNTFNDQVKQSFKELKNYKLAPIPVRALVVDRDHEKTVFHLINTYSKLKMESLSILYYNTSFFS